ncbi:glycosyltransferase family 2 protein [Ruania halotolerans]|uniref:glycosyltransferase family 2 protein n=1 Tax=Ruania halotolerans TaxID=2897773 RepID=UPI001E492A6E|nr:glycosyltransferase family 2 protein [Ruania halotolerans]UFU07548.1 glycosyltransferase family 2 protein [Ruania halotolerans]
MATWRPTHVHAASQPDRAPSGISPDDDPPRPGVDVVIAVHSTERPIARAVRSVLDHNGEGVRLTVVCHNIAASQIRPLLDAAHREKVVWLEHRDSHRSASGPFNVGMAAAVGDYVAIMGSDDILAPGAIASWYWLGRKTGADAVIARLERGTDRVIVPTPPTRVPRRQILDGVADRLCYRSAPLGLVSREAIVRFGLRLEEGAQVGGDVGFVTRLWFHGKITFDRSGPPYVIGEDATDRVTYAPRPIAVELKFLRTILAASWFERLSLEQRRAAVVKYLRIHLFGAVWNRQDPRFWTEQERADLAGAARRLLRAAPGAEAVLSLADRDLLDAVLDPNVDTDRMLARAVARRRHGRPGTLITRDLAQLLAREAPLRLMVASALTR